MYQTLTVKCHSWPNTKATHCFLILFLSSAGDMRQAYNSSAKFHRLQPATAELWNLSNWLYFVHHPVLLTILTHKTQLWKSVQSQWGIPNQHLKVVWSHFSSLVSNKYYDVCDHRMKPLYMDFCFENYALSSSGINCNVLKNICAEQSRNLHSSGTELLKVENPKISSNPGIAWTTYSIPELCCARSWNVAQCWNFTLFPQLCNAFNDNRCYLMEEKRWASQLACFGGGHAFCWRNRE